MVFGGSGSKDVEILVKVDATGAIETFDQLGNKLSRVEKESEDAARSFSGIDAALDGLKLTVGLATAAFAALGSAAAIGIASISRGSEVDDLSTAFDNLTKKAGGVSDVLLNDLNSALGNTVTNFDLMKQANELLIGGLKPDQITLVAEAARALGEQTGVSAKEGMDALADSLLRGNDRALKSLGIVIDNTKAEAEFAKSIGTTADKLSEAGKVEALRIASLTALSEQSEKFGAVTDDAGDKLSQFSKFLSDAKDEFAQAIANNQGLNEALANLGEEAKKIDFKQFAESIAGAATVVLNLASNVLPILIRELGYLAEGIKAIPGEIEKVLNGVKYLEGRLNGYANSIQNAQTATRDFLGIKADPNSAFAKMDRIFQNATATGELFKHGLDSVKKAASDSFGIIKDAVQGANVQLSYFTEAVGPQQFIGPINKAAQETEKLGKGFINLGDSSKKAQKDIKEGIDQGFILAELFAKNNQQVQKAADEAKKAAEDIAKQFNDELNSTIGGALGDALGAALTGGDVKAAISAGGQQLGSLLGTELGGAIGGPFGAAFGGALGGQLGQKIATDIAGIFDGGKSSKKGVSTLLDTIFPGLGTGFDKLLGDKLFGESKGTAIRKQIDKFFADAFDANRLLVIINGQLEQIKDLDLGGGTFASPDGAAGQFFAGLSESAQAAFSGVAEGFSTLLGTGEEAAIGLAQAFAENLGGSLNNLQLLVQASGVSFEQLHDSVVNAFLDGKLSALEAQTALNELAVVAQDGIPGALGATTEAFENLKAAGVKGGRALVDAIKDIGFEAKEVGIKDFGQLQASLLASGKFTQQEIEQLFATLRANGIDSIEELTSATNEQLLPVLSALQAQEFPFAEAASDAGELITTIQDLPNEKTLTFNIKTNFDSNTQRAQSEGYVPSLATNISTAGGNKSIAA